MRSYPEVIFGVKDEFRTSAPKSQTGLPVRVDNIGTVTIDFDWDSTQFGEPRLVDASVNPRFPNGTTIFGERNVAIESFFYNGVCEDSLSVTRSNGSNHVFEMLVWLDGGAERLPSGPGDFVTNVTIGGSEYKVFTKSSDSAFLTFASVEPQNRGSIVWSDFVNWAKENSASVVSTFGAAANTVQLQDSWCMANILIGTEIFWGAGEFNLNTWSITQTN